MTKLISQIPYGLLPGQLGIELFADRETKTMHFLRDGERLPFKALPVEITDKLMEQMLSDEKAMKDLQGNSWQGALEQYCFCVYGAADSTPDIDANGNLMPSDNFVCGDNCRCLKWESKNMTVNGHVLTSRHIEVINALNSDLTQFQIAEKLGIKLTTLNTTKKVLFERFNVLNTTSLVSKAIDLKVIQ